jgi:hypothetical protein
MKNTIGYGSVRIRENCFYIARIEYDTRVSINT